MRRMPSQQRQPSSSAIRFRSLDELQDFKYWLSLLKVFVMLLAPSVVLRLLTGDFWGSLNASAGPIVGIFLLKDDDPAFAQCYEYLSRIWLVNECCGIQRGMNFTYTLSIFMLINAVNGLLDLYQFVFTSFSTDSLSGLALTGCLGGEAACFAICVQIQKAIRRPPGGSRGPGGTSPRAQDVSGRRTGRAVSGATAPLPRGPGRHRGNSFDVSPHEHSRGEPGRRRRTSAPPSVYARAVTDLGLAEPRRVGSGHVLGRSGESHSEAASSRPRPRRSWFRPGQREGGVDLEAAGPEGARQDPGSRDSDDSEGEAKPGKRERLRSFLFQRSRSLSIPENPSAAAQGSPGDQRRRKASRSRQST